MREKRDLATSAKIELNADRRGALTLYGHTILTGVRKHSQVDSPWQVIGSLVSVIASYRYP